MNHPQPKVQMVSDNNNNVIYMFVMHILHYVIPIVFPNLFSIFTNDFGISSLTFSADDILLDSNILYKSCLTPHNSPCNAAFEYFKPRNLCVAN